MENSLKKESTPLAQYDSIRLSLKKYSNLGEISNKHNDDQQRAFLLENNGRNKKEPARLLLRGRWTSIPQSIIGGKVHTLLPSGYPWELAVLRYLN